jgi:hypothetical protein
MERRREPRIQTDLTVHVWGMDSGGAFFVQEAHARSLSGNGALLSAIQPSLRCGDLIWVQYGGQRARFRVVWVRDSKTQWKIQAAIQKFDGDECPWKELLSRQPQPA